MRILNVIIVIDVRVKSRTCNRSCKLANFVCHVSVAAVTVLGLEALFLLFVLLYSQRVLIHSFR